MLVSDTGCCAQKMMKHSKKQGASNRTHPAKSHRQQRSVQQGVPRRERSVSLCWGCDEPVPPAHRQACVCHGVADDIAQAGVLQHIAQHAAAGSDQQDHAGGLQRLGHDLFQLGVVIAVTGAQQVHSGDGSHQHGARRGRDEGVADSQTGCGYICRNSFCTEAQILPPRSNRMYRELVVPWSSDMIYFMVFSYLCFYNGYVFACHHVYLKLATN